MSGNLVEVRKKSGKGQGICVVMEIRLWQLNKITFLCFIDRTAIRFSHVMFTENLD